MLRPALLDRALWPLYPVEHSWRSRGVPHTNLPIPGLPWSENPTSWSAWQGPVGVEPPSLQPAYGGIFDTSPNVCFGGGPGAGAGVMSNWGGLASIITLDPSRPAEALAGPAPKLYFQPSPSMAFQTPPTLGDLAFKIPAGP